MIILHHKHKKGVLFWVFHDICSPFLPVFIQDDDEDQTHSASALAEEKKKIPDPDSEEVSEVDVQNIIE